MNAVMMRTYMNRLAVEKKLHAEYDSVKGVNPMRAEGSKGPTKPDNNCCPFGARRP